MKFILLLVVLFTVSCGKRHTYSSWTDGDFHIYTTNGHRPKLGAYKHPGYFVLVKPEVIALGSNHLWIVAQQYDHGAHSNNNYYIINKKTEHSEGPMDQSAFEAMSKERALPSFTWFNEPDL